MELGLPLDINGPDMSDDVDVTIVGAGPGGSTAALLLARSGRRVRIVDRDTFPRTKLCGEFLSGEGVATLYAQGLDSRLRTAGARPVGRLLVTTRSGTTFGHPLTNGAIAIARNRLDTMLLDEAACSGAQPLTGDGVQSIAGSLSEGFRVATASQEWRSRVVVGAFGRSSTLARVLGTQTIRKTRDPLVAFKSHVVGSMDDGVVELHGFDNGYCGLLLVAPDTINVCWIARASALRAAGGKPGLMLESLLRNNNYLKERLNSIRTGDLEFHAASQLSFRSQTIVVRDVFMVGDAAGMIAPMCGDGMAMAIQGAALLAPLVEAFLGGRLEADRLKSLYKRAWYARFSHRMWLGRLLHHGFMSNGISELGVRICRTSPGVGQFLVSATRGNRRAA